MRLYWSTIKLMSYICFPIQIQSNDSCARAPDNGKIGKTKEYQQIFSSSAISVATLKAAIIVDKTIRLSIIINNPDEIDRHRENMWFALYGWDLPTANNLTGH